MTNLTIDEKRALEEVFLCFSTEDKWYCRYNLKNKIVKLLNKNIKLKIPKLKARLRSY